MLLTAHIKIHLKLKIREGKMGKKLIMIAAIIAVIGALGFIGIACTANNQVKQETSAPLVSQKTSMLTQEEIKSLCSKNCSISEKLSQDASVSQEHWKNINPAGSLPWYALNTDAKNSRPQPLQACDLRAYMGAGNTEKEVNCP